jgi:hypothetical protein
MGRARLGARDEEAVFSGQQRHPHARVRAGGLALQETELRRVEELRVRVVERGEHLPHVLHVQDAQRHRPVVVRRKLGAHLGDDARRALRPLRPASDRGEPEREGAHDGHREAQDPGHAPQAT